jgi:hypothetical protein
MQPAGSGWKSPAPTLGWGGGMGAVGVGGDRYLELGL